MTIEQSDHLLRTLFHWTTSPLDSATQRDAAISKVAAIVCDTGSAWLKLVVAPDDGPQLARDVLQLHESYQRVKGEYKLPVTVTVAQGGSRG